MATTRITKAQHDAVVNALTLANEVVNSLTAKNLELSAKIEELEARPDPAKLLEKSAAALEELTARFEALKAENERLESQLDKPATQPVRSTPKIGDPAGKPWVGRDGVTRQKFWVDVNRRWTTTREVAA